MPYFAIHLLLSMHEDLDLDKRKSTGLTLLRFPKQHFLIRVRIIRGKFEPREKAKLVRVSGKFELTEFELTEK